MSNRYVQFPGKTDGKNTADNERRSGAFIDYARTAAPHRVKRPPSIDRIVFVSRAATRAILSLSNISIPDIFFCAQLSRSMAPKHCHKRVARVLNRAFRWY